MTNDNILDRIDAVLGHEDTVIDDDWSVSTDAMRSRPPGEHDLPHWAELPAGLAPGRVSFVPRIGDPLHPTTAELAAGIDLSPHFNNRHTIMPAGLLSEMSRTLDAAMGFPGLPEPRPNLRLRIIQTLGLMPILIRLNRGIAQLLDRARRVVDLLTPRRATRARRSRTIRIDLVADVAEFNRNMRDAGDRLAEFGMTGRSAYLGLFDFMHAAIDLERLERLERQVAAYDRIMAKSEIRAIADVHRHEAHRWLDEHVDTIWADLGMTRPRED